MDPPKRKNNPTPPQIMEAIEIDVAQRGELEVAIERFMLDPQFPDRLKAIGTNSVEDRTRAAAVMASCQEEFLEGRMNWGMRIWGHNIKSSFEPRTLYWPEDKDLITMKMRPVFRRPLTNHRQMIKQRDYRRSKQAVKFQISVLGADGSREVPRWTEKVESSSEYLSYNQLVDLIHVHLQTGCDGALKMLMLGPEGMKEVQDDQSHSEVVQSVLDHPWLDGDIKVMINSTEIEKAMAEKSSKEKRDRGVEEDEEIDGSGDAEEANNDGANDDTDLLATTTQPSSKRQRQTRE